jgi:hypothetical protein
VIRADVVDDQDYDPRAARRTTTPGHRTHRARERRSEALVCRDVDAALADEPRVYIMNITGSAEQVAGTPDRVGVVDGRAFVCEIKAPGERPRPLQLVELRRWQDGGALAGWVTSVAELRELLARVHDRSWTNPLTGPGDPTLGAAHDAGASVAERGS